MTKAIIGLFDDINTARSVKIMLERLNIMDNQAQLIVKDDKAEGLNKITDYGFSKDETENMNNGFGEGNTILFIQPVDNYQEVFKFMVDNNARSVFRSKSLAVNEIINDLDLEYENLQEIPNENNYISESELKDNLESRVINRNDFNIELHEEELEISKKEVESGEVIVRKEIIKEIKTIEIPVIREELVIERKHLNNDDAIINFEVERIPLSEEIIDVNKKVLIKENVDIKKIKVQDTVIIDESIKKEELHISKNNLKV